VTWKSILYSTIQAKCVAKQWRSVRSVTQLAWCGEGCFDSRRRVNSIVSPLLDVEDVPCVKILVSKIHFYHRRVSEG